MDLNGIPLFGLLQNKLGYLSAREKLIAQNVANSATPGFTPRDLKPFSQQPGVTSGPSTSARHGVAVAATQTDSAHMTMSSMDDTMPSPTAATYVSVVAPDSESTLDGNQVVLEEQMIKMNEARNDYDAAVGFYQKAMGMLHLAVQKPGG
jgi:flagellar basal-body rod protein FlgB